MRENKLNTIPSLAALLPCIENSFTQGILTGLWGTKLVNNITRGKIMGDYEACQLFIIGIKYFLI